MSPRPRGGRVWSKLAEASRLPSGLKATEKTTSSWPRSVAEQLPVADLVEPQVALGGRLAAGDGEQLAVGAELQIVDGAEDVGQHLDGLALLEVPDGDLAVAAGREQLAVRAEGDGGDRRERADLQGEFELAGLRLGLLVRRGLRCPSSEPFDRRAAHTWCRRECTFRSRGTRLRCPSQRVPRP